MSDKLARELGIYSVVSVACGAMLSGLLVLPGYAAAITGPSVFLAFLVAGILFLPATLSKSEMATALPEAGGDYIFIDRALGPLFSTISGLGMYLTFLLKSAFALAGMGAYLLMVASVPYRFAQLFSVVVAVLLTLLNYRGAKKTGLLQRVLFFVTVLALLLFMGRGSIEVSHENFKPFLTNGWTGFWTAVAFVFVSFAGVTKIASIAEEIENPDQTIPVGMLVSLGIMVLLYVFVVYVMVGNIPTGEFDQKKYLNAPLALAGIKLGGWWGKVFISSVSVVALVAMANAGLMACSRYPLALSRYDQLPEIFGRIHSSYSTPAFSILFTGLLLCVLIQFFPVIQLAKLASTFKLLVLGLLNAALIILRESDIEWYRPSFRSPGYPYVQIIGIVASIVLIGFLGWVPFFSSVGLITTGVGWYFFYVKSRIDRKGAIQRDRIPEESRALFEQLRQDSSDRPDGSVLVPVFELRPQDLPSVERRIRLAGSLCSPEDVLEIVHFCEVPAKSFFANFNPDKAGIDRLGERVDLLRNHLDAEITLSQIVTHHTHGALRSFVENSYPKCLVYKWVTPSRWRFLVGKQKWWLRDFPCNLAFFDDHDRIEHKDVFVLMDPVPFEVDTIRMADRIARHHDGRITFLNPGPTSAAPRDHFSNPYQDQLKKLCKAPTYEKHLDPDNWVKQLQERTNQADLLVLGTLGEHELTGNLGRDLEDRIIQELNCNVMRVRTKMRYSLSQISQSDGGDPAVDEILRNAQFSPELNVDNKEKLFETLSEMLEKPDLDKGTILDALWSRENLSHTYLEDGIAFPHAMLDGAEEIIVGFAFTNEPLVYTEDGEEADTFAVLVGPEESRELQLKIMRIIARLLSNYELEQLLKGRFEADASASA